MPSFTPVEKEGRKGKLRVSSLVFYGLTLVTLASCVYCFVQALSWVNRPFPGFLLYKPPYVGSYSNRDWAGRQAGLKYLDRILTVDGTPVHSGKDITQALEGKAPGTPVHYVVERKGRTRDITIPVSLFGLKDFLLVFFAPYLCGLIVFGLGFVVFVLKPNTPTSWVFLILCFCVAMYGITGFEIQSSYLLVRLHYAVLSLLPAAFFHLGLIFPDRKKMLQRFPPGEYLVYVPVVLLIFCWELYLSLFPKMLFGGGHVSSLLSYKFLGSMSRIFMLLCVAGLIGFIVHASYRAASNIARQRGRVVLFGVSIAFLPPAILMLLTVLFKINFAWNIIAFFVIFFPLSIAYSIVRHNLFDADAIIKRTVGYFVVTGILVSAYVVISLGLNVLAGKYHFARSEAFPIVFTIGVILVFNPLRDRVQAVVDRLFFRKEYDYGEIVDRIGGAITSLLDLKEVLNRLVQTFVKDMFLSTGSILLRDAAGGGYRVGLAAGEEGEQVERAVFGREDSLVQILEKEKRELTRYDVLEDPKYRRVRDACARGFDTVRASLMVPMVFQDKVIGLMSLGDKKSGKFFNREDVDLLHTLANQGAVAIENARLFEENLEKQRMEEELNIARDLQMSMLPAACPEVAGLDIAAFSVPAREVGGDFYDFIEMGKHKVGIVVGDVTGKSVSGALVMAASRSIFRMLSEQSLPVGEIMNYANRRTKKDIRSGMFVALLYVVVDGDKRTLRLCSAGQTQPIRLSSATGSTELIETEGDTFPLGILDEALYQETQVQLDPGDRVVFYTDGIVEAMNEKEEIFGFERLHEVVEAGLDLSAEELLQLILERVNAFVGSAEQHDDLTVIVVSMEG